MTNFLKVIIWLTYKPVIKQIAKNVTPSVKHSFEERDTDFATKIAFTNAKVKQLCFLSPLGKTCSKSPIFFLALTF